MLKKSVGVCIAISLVAACLISICSELENVKQSSILTAVKPSDVLTGTYVSGNITANTTWTVRNSPYIVVDNVTVSKNATLTIEPGVEVRFDGYYRLTIRGKLNATGIPEREIIFTSNKTNPKPRDWYSIVLNQTVPSTLAHCQIWYAVYGVDIRPTSSHNTITYCKFYNNAVYSIHIYRSLNGHNRISNCVMGDDEGIVISGPNNIVENNVIKGVSKMCAYGVQSYAAQFSLIMNNSIEYCNYGFYIDSSPSNVIAYNNVTRCHTDIALFYPSSTDNKIHHNNFFSASSGNIVALVFGAEKNYWDNGTEGNYWDDYKGTDNNNDGIGDTPYRIGPYDQDNFPLMRPVSNAGSTLPEVSINQIPFVIVVAILFAIIRRVKTSK